MSDWSNYGQEPVDSSSFESFGSGQPMSSDEMSAASPQPMGDGAMESSFAQPMTEAGSYVQPYPRPASQSSPQQGDTPSTPDSSGGSSMLESLDKGAGEAVHSLSNGVDDALNSDVGKAVTGATGQVLDVAGNPLKYLKKEKAFAEGAAEKIGGDPAKHAVSFAGDFEEQLTAVGTLNFGAYKDSVVDTAKDGLSVANDAKNGVENVAKGAAHAAKDVGDKAEDVAKDIGHAFGF